MAEGGGGGKFVRLTPPSHRTNVLNLAVLLI